MQSVIHREILATWKVSTEFNNALQNVIKIINHIKVHVFNPGLFMQWGDEHRTYMSSLVQKREMTF